MLCSRLKIFCSGIAAIALAAASSGSEATAGLTSRSARLRPVQSTPIDYENPAAWLRRYSVPLTSLSINDDNRDLESLRHWIGSSTLVGLGDTSHGTREFYLWKIRVVAFLVEEMGFTTLALEAPWPYVYPLDDYINGGAGDPVALLRNEAYWFWSTEETLELLQWLRAYNGSRGERPAVRLAGIDPWLATPLKVDIARFLYEVDRAAAEAAEETYRCFAKGPMTLPSNRDACLSAIERTADAIASNRELYVARTSELRHRRALRSARMMRQTAEIAFSHVPQGTRDQVMADNVTWTRASLAAAETKTILWGHSVHLGKLPYDLKDGRGRMESVGAHLHRRHPDYFVIGSTTREGAFSSVTISGGVQSYAPATIPQLSAESYEQLFGTGYAAALIPLANAPAPRWLSEPRPLLFMFANPATIQPRMAVTEQYDAVVHIDQTTPTRLLR